MRGATIKIFEDGFGGPEGRDAASFGHGAQRSIQIALIKCLSEIKRNVAVSPSRTTLLLIDEPELYLHPQAIEVMRASLGRLSHEGYQVAFTTHSANMISRDDAPNALLIRRRASVGTTANPRMRDAVQTAIAESTHQSETLFTLTNSSKILFSEKVMLVEGKTERALLPEIYGFEKGRTFDEDKTGLVPLDGSSNFLNAAKVLSTMGVPTKIVADLDFAFKIAVKNGLIAETHAGVVGCMAIFQQLGSTGLLTLDTNGLPKRDGVKTAAQGFEEMAKQPGANVLIDSIFDDLKPLGIWIWKRGTIESHLGLLGKTPALHVQFLADFQTAT